MTLTATESAADGTNPAGSVQFEVDGTAIGSPVAVNGSGAASTVTSFATVFDTESLTAVFTPSNPAYTGSTGTYSLFVSLALVPVEAVMPLAATVPPSGSLTMTVTPGTATLAVSGSTAAGTLPAVTVTDTRNYYPGWSATGEDSGFTGSAAAVGGTIQGNQLGWTPTVVAPLQGGAALGLPVAAAAPGLETTAATLASAPVGSGYGTNVLSANLILDIPSATPAGPYAGTLTLTLVDTGP